MTQLKHRYDFQKKKACPSSLKTPLSDFPNRAPCSAFPHPWANSVTGWNRLPLRTPSQCKRSRLSLHLGVHWSQGADVRLGKGTCSQWHSGSHPPTYPRALKRRWSPALGEGLKYGFLEHDPHCDYHFSVCLVLLQEVQKNWQWGG